MKANEITAADRERWKKANYIVAVCRICNDVMLYPGEHYKPEQFVGYECLECKRRYAR